MPRARAAKSSAPRPAARSTPTSSRAPRGKKKAAGKKAAGKKTAGKKTTAEKTVAPKTAGKKKSGKTKAERAARPPSSARHGVQAAVEGIRAYALAKPEAYEEFPWDHSALKVRKKVFVFLPREGTYVDTATMSLKLPHTSDVALTLSCVEPTGYGLGRSGWVTVRLDADDCPPVPMLCEWVDESYRAVAPKSFLTKHNLA